jgi:hypothetical protein
LRAVDDQFGLQVIGGGPADDAAGGGVDDGGQIELAFLRGDVGDVASPADVDQGGADVALDQVGAGGDLWVGDGGAVLASAVQTSQSGLSHEPGHHAAPAAGALTPEYDVEARNFVGSAALFVHGGDLLGQLGVPHRAGTRGAGVVGREGDSGELDRPFSQVRTRSWFG